MLVDLIFSLLGMILTILIIVGIHEGAHFGVARLLGIKVLQFSIGFGKALYRWRDRKGTEYVIAPIPLGGYVKLLDETEGPVAEAEKHLAFNRQPLYKRAAVVAAGPLSNLVLAFLLYWVIFACGFKTSIPLIGEVELHSIASDAGLKTKQEIIAIDGYKTLSWASISMRLVVHTGDHDTLAIQTISPQHETKEHILNLDSWEMNDLKPDPLSSLGITPYFPEIPLVIGRIIPGSPADIAQLKIGDELLTINKKAIKNWNEFITFISKNPDQNAKLAIKRNHKKMNLDIQIKHQRNLFFKKYGFLGIAPDYIVPDNLLRTVQYGPFDAGIHAIKEVGALTYFNVVLLLKLMSGKLSVLSLGGPITIFEIAGSSFSYGIIPFLSFLAFLSVALGVINFVPIPGLDGGHLLFQFIEFIARRPVSIRIQTLFYKLGFIFLLVILIQAVANDLLRLWN
jgi:regulator of sigma E protease